MSAQATRLFACGFGGVAELRLLVNSGAILRDCLWLVQKDRSIVVISFGLLIIFPLLRSFNNRLKVQKQQSAAQARELEMQKENVDLKVIRRFSLHFQHRNSPMILAKMQ